MRGKTGAVSVVRLAAATFGFLVLLMPGVARAEVPVTVRTLQLSIGLAVGGGDDDDLWGAGLAGGVGYTFPKPVYLGIAIDAFPHEKRSSSFGEVLGQVGYDFATGADPQLVVRPTIGMGVGHVAQGSKTGPVLGPGLTLMLAASVILFSAEVRYDLVYLSPHWHQGGVASFGIGLAF